MPCTKSSGQGGDATSDAPVLLKFLRGARLHGRQAPPLVQRVEDLGAVATCGELLPEEALKGANDLEGG
jgi:hypothetical protein